MAQPGREPTCLRAEEGALAGFLDGELSSVIAPQTGEPAFVPVLGITNSDLVIAQISADVRALLGHRPGDLVGRPIFDLIRSHDAEQLRRAFAHTLTDGIGVIVSTHLKSIEGHLLPGQILVVPLAPPPKLAFVLLPSRPALDGESNPAPAIDDMERAVRRLERRIDAVGETRDSSGIAAKRIPPLPLLSSRELKIVSSLMSGDRVPVIAEALFISQSTVRNHLSAAFRKCGVKSQQELIALLRDSDSSSA